MKRETEIKESQEATTTELEKRRCFGLISQLVTKRLREVEESEQPGKGKFFLETNFCNYILIKAKEHPNLGKIVGPTR